MPQMNEKGCTNCKMNIDGVSRFSKMKSARKLEAKKLETP